MFTQLWGQAACASALGLGGAMRDVLCADVSVLMRQQTWHPVPHTLQVPLWLPPGLVSGAFGQGHPAHGTAMLGAGEQRAAWCRMAPERQQAQQSMWSQDKPQCTKRAALRIALRNGWQPQSTMALRTPRQGSLRGQRSGDQRSPEDKAVEEDQGDEAGKQVDEPDGALLEEAHKPQAVPHRHLLLLNSAHSGPFLVFCSAGHPVFSKPHMVGTLWQAGRAACWH